MDKKLTYSEAIERVLLENNYFAPLKKIYKMIPKYRPLTGKTPFNTIQERVQRDPRFTRIGLGVYALTKYLDKLPTLPKPRNKEEEREHTHYSAQGILLEIGNSEDYDTCSPNKNAIFDNKRLAQLMTIDQFPDFTYPNIIQAVKFIDVLWFNKRGFPKLAFEIEYTTQFRNSLIKFTELADFQVHFYFISTPENKDKYCREVSRTIFREIRERCKFKTYDQVKGMYIASIEKRRASEDFFRP